MKTIIDDLKNLIELVEIGTGFKERQKRLKRWNLQIGDFILVEKTKDVSGIIYNDNHKGKIYVVIGVLNGNLHVKGINNDHWGYLHIEHVEKYKIISNKELKKLLK